MSDEPVNKSVPHEVGGEGPAAKAEREAKEKAAKADQAAAEAAAKAEADAAAKAEEPTHPKRSHH